MIVLYILCIVLPYVVLSLLAPAPTPAPPIRINCNPYSVTNTNNDTQNYDTCNYTLPSYTEATITASTCMISTGITYLRAYVNGQQVAYSANNNQGCGSANEIQMIFTIPSQPNSQTITIREGCYETTSCGSTVVLFITTVVPPFPTCSGIPQLQYDALHALYMSTNGSGWSNTCNNWVFSSSPNYSAPCNGWYGIKCSQCQVIQMILSRCHLTGFLPSQLGNITSMTHLDLSDNSLTGSIPSQVGSLDGVQYLNLSYNGLTGTIPSQLGLMTSSMNFLDLSYNSLTGTIPSQLEFMISMIYLSLGGNSLTGTIPSQLGSMTTMNALDLSYNSLIGFMPSQLGSMISINILELSHNSLIGTIPSQLESMINLRGLLLSSNSLTGTIPSQLGSLTYMRFFDLSYNRLTGTIPTSLTLYQQVGYIYLQNNNLVGTVPTGIMSLSSLAGINLSNNMQLSSNVQLLFNIDTSEALVYIILANMNLAGSLSDVIFDLPQLNTLVLSSNHISGTLPPSICTSSLITLILDGIGTGLEKGQGFYGSIPSCIFSSNLTTLNLAGNGLTGSLPEVPESSPISKLNVARNLLIGDIPVSMQMHRFVGVDMSFNKITGTLSDSFEPPLLTLNMSVNRLSGSAPSTLQTSNVTLNILEGNLFACPLLRNNENSDQVDCGSSNLEFPFRTWLVLMSMAILLAVVMMHTTILVSEDMKQQVLDWWQAYNQIQTSKSSSRDAYHTRSTMNYLEHACSMSLVVSIVFVLVVMMSLIGMKLHDANHTKSLYQVQYLYTVTSAYLVGVTPAVLTWLYLTVEGVIVVVLCVSIRPRPRSLTTTDTGDVDSTTTITDEEAAATTVYQEHVRASVIRFSVAAVVIAAALAINYGFVQIVYFTKPAHLSTIQFAFAVIKALFSAFIVPVSTRLVPKASRQLHMVVMTIVVNVVGPGLATLLSSPLCLYYKLKQSSISVSYTYPVAAFNEASPTEVDVVSTFTPAWFYSYQCSSSFLTSYLPNFVYLYVINGIISPVVNFLVMIFLSIIYESYVREYYIRGANLFLLITGVEDIKVGKIFFIRGIQQESKEGTSCSSIEMSVVDSPFTKGSDRNTTRESARATIAAAKKFKLNVSDLTPTLCVDITLLLTFGLASPLLGVIIGTSIVTNVFLFRLAIGRYIGIVSKALGINACNELLESAFGDQWRCLTTSWWMMSIFIGMFWSLFVFDMIGDMNPDGGIIAAILMLILCPTVFILIQSAMYINPDTASSSSSSSITNLYVNSFNRYRERVLDAATWIHISIWKHVFRVRTICHEMGSSTTSNNADIDRVSTMIETVSPFGSLNTEGSQSQSINDSMANSSSSKVLLAVA